jgi:hypothetical protein
MRSLCQPPSSLVRGSVLQAAVVASRIMHLVDGWPQRAPHSVRALDRSLCASITLRVYSTQQPPLQGPCSSLCACSQTSSPRSQQESDLPSLCRANAFQTRFPCAMLTLRMIWLLGWSDCSLSAGVISQGIRRPDRVSLQVYNGFSGLAPHLRMVCDDCSPLNRVDMASARCYHWSSSNLLGRAQRNLSPQSHHQQERY